MDKAVDMIMDTVLYAITLLLMGDNFPAFEKKNTLNVGIFWILFKPELKNIVWHFW